MLFVFLLFCNIWLFNDQTILYRLNYLSWLFIVRSPFFLKHRAARLEQNHGGDELVFFNMLCDLAYLVEF